MEFNQKLINLLKKDAHFVDKEGNLIKSVIINSAIKIDKEFISLLIKDKEVKDSFFEKIEDLWIFNINKFVDYVQDKNVFSNSVTKFEAQIGLNIDNKFLGERGEVSLVWPFKDCVLEGGMTKEDQKRDEIFFNEILAKDEIDRLEEPKVLTNFKKYIAKGEEKVKDFARDENGTIKDNLIIKGNNLLALHSLKKEFAGKIKLIYIDPPYNTGGATEIFTYNNNFKHSTWLTFIKNRLDIAKELLQEDGFIAITIDHAELFYLGALADEIFGRENRIGIVTIVIKEGGRNLSKGFAPTNEYMLVYKKNNGEIRNVIINKELEEQFDKEDDKGKYKEKKFIRDFDPTRTRHTRPKQWYPIYVSADLTKITLDKKGGYHEVWPISSTNREMVWDTQPDTFMQLVNNGEIIAKKIDGKVNILKKQRMYQVIKTHWAGSKYDSVAHGTKLLKKLMGDKIFSYPKSLYSVIDTLKITTSGSDIILDFFAGSGTTGHATLELNKEDGGNRQFILVEQLDTHMDVIKKRIQKVMELNSKEKNLNNYNKDEHFVYGELLKYNEEAIDKIQDAKDIKALLKIWEEMCDKYFLNYDVDIKKFNDNKKDFESLTLKQQKEVLMAMLNKNQLYVNLSEIEDKQFNVSKEEKELNKKFYKED